MTTSLLQVLLPPVKSTATAFYDHSNDPWFKYRSMESEAKKFSGAIVKPVPAYLNRQGFRPDQGFGDGGAFPEIHVSQYPLGMGKNRSNKTLPVTLDPQGNVVFNAVVRQQSEISNKIVYSRPYDVIPKILKNEGDLLVDDEELKKQIHETAEETKAAIEKRLAADGRGLEEAQVSDDFAKLTEALYVAEQKAREAVSVRAKVQKEMVMKEKERKEQELRDLAQNARRERAEAAVTLSSESVERPGGDCETERKQRDKIREERRTERERERRLETAGAKKSKITRDSERDITEKVALGMATVGGRGVEESYQYLYSTILSILTVSGWIYLPVYVEAHL